MCKKKKKKKIEQKLVIKMKKRAEVLTKRTYIQYLHVMCQHYNEQSL